MIRRRFGRTELQMPVFSCGGMRYQQSWKDVPETPISDITDENQRNLEATIHRSIEVGINHIETARGYGTSEYQLGKVLPTLPRDEIIVQTKIGPQDSAEAFMEVFENCMGKLKLDYVDLLGIHGINNPEILDKTLRKDGMWKAVTQLRKEGRIRFVGFSTHGNCVSNVKVINTGEFDYVNLHWYYVDQSNWPAIEAATRQDMGVFIISPNDKGGKLYSPSRKLVELCDPLTPMGFNDLFCLSHPEVHTLSLGVSCPSDFDAHLEILPYLDQAKETIAPVMQRIENEMEKVLGRHWLQNWQVNLPEWYDVPNEVNNAYIFKPSGGVVHPNSADLGSPGGAMQTHCH